MFQFLRQVFVYGILAAAAYAGVRYAELRYHASEFDVFVKNEVKYAPTREGTDPSNIRDKVLGAAPQFGMTLDPDDVRIKRTYDYDQERSTLQVDVTYSSMLDLPSVHHQFTFHSSAAVTF